MTKQKATPEGARLPYPPDTGRTHYVGCWAERGHHNCALLEIERLQAQISGHAPPSGDTAVTEPSHD